MGTLADNMLLSTLGLKEKTDVGHDVVVAVLDSGIVNSDQIPIVGFYDFVNNGGAKVKQYDDYGHGRTLPGSSGTRTTRAMRATAALRMVRNSSA